MLKKSWYSLGMFCLSLNSTQSNILRCTSFISLNYSNAFLYFCFSSSFALSGSGLVDSDFMDTLRKQQSDLGDDEKETYDFQKRLERQEESIKDLQAAVDAQTELLRTIADKLDIGK